MQKLTHESLYSLEQYAKIRNAFRKQVIDHKKHRRVALGDHAALYFEDQMTMQYQVQEMLRIERIFEHEGIQEELDVYNPLIPDGNNWKATFMLEYDDVDERKQELAKLVGVEQALWVQVADFERVHPIANEDLDRTTDEKTSSVHFVRFELTDEMVSAAKSGASVRMGIDHPAYQADIEVSGETKKALVGDLD